MGPGFIACDREQSFLMPPDVRDWLPENHLAWLVLAAVGGDGSVRVLRGVPRRRAQPSGLRAGDDGRPIALRLRARDPLLARDRARVHRRRRVAGGGGAAASGSRDDRALYRAPRDGAGRPVRRGPAAVREVGPG